MKKKLTKMAVFCCSKIKDIIASIFITVLVSNCTERKVDIQENRIPQKSTKLIDSLATTFNDSIEYRFVIPLCDTCAPITNLGWRVSVDMTNAEDSIVRRIRYKDWINLLHDDQRDWAANLLLYDIYQKDALILSQTKNGEIWRRTTVYKEDLSYWDSILSKGR